MEMTVKKLLAVLWVGCGTLWAGATPMHVTYLWHMHQPIYYPYESPGQIDAAGRFNFSVQGVWDGDRIGAYTSWPRDAVQSASDKGHAHGGAQMSYSGSLAENNNNLWGYSTGASWDDGIDWARNGLRTSLNNPRLDTVGIAYHHSLMPLTCKESMIMQIRLHKEQNRELWDSGDYSKGFWPPECAFAEWMIPALVEEGLEWVIVDNGHLFRTVPDFPWSSASSCRPNPAEIQNPSAGELGSQWVQLQNVWAPTKVLAPWSYQPHYVQYVNPNTGAKQKLVAVPAGRYEGNENGRGGYGAFKPENVWGPHVGSVNTDSSHPMLLLCHSDGDNYGMKNSDAWHGQHNAFLDMCAANGDFDHTSVQDYLDMYPPDIDDVIHVEPGSWIGIDGGTPYFEKWLSSTYVDGENPDRWSWSVLVAAQNRVLTADALENSYLGSSPNMDNVEWGIGDDTARAWHWYLSAETSCYWYWDLDRANPWDGNVTRACNQALVHANAVIGRHPGSDPVGPSIFPPQRDPYNPGGFMWNESTPAASDFEVWSFVDDAGGLSAVRLYWRTDKDGVNPIATTDNETYAGGGEVNGWNIEAMSGEWNPSVKGPDHIVPSPTARAQMYKAMVTGQSQVLIDYFVEAVDNSGNTNRSLIQHVYVGQFNATNAVPVTFTPTTPRDCDELTISYNAAGRSLAAAGAVTLGLSFDDGATNAYAMSGTAGGVWRFTNAIPDGARLARAVFFDGATRDDNGGAGWTRSIEACPVPASVRFDPAAPDGCDPVTVIYHAGSGPLAAATQVWIHVGFNGWQGVTTPDPVMAPDGTNWTYVYSPPVDAYEIGVCFHNGAGVWDNNSGQDYTVGVTACSSTNATVAFSPSAPNECDGNLLTIAYRPDGRPLEGEPAIFADVSADRVSWNRLAMTSNESAWSVSTGIPMGATNFSVAFVNAMTGPTVTDDNGGLYWVVAVSACQTGGPSAASFNPAEPTGCDPVVIEYAPNNGLLRQAATVRIHVGRNGWQDVVDADMSRIGNRWVYTNALLAGTYQVDCCFHDGAGTWDNNFAGDWHLTVAGCTAEVAQVRLVAHTPALSDDPEGQNAVGEAFDLETSGGLAEGHGPSGFGDFGRIYFNYDTNALYIGATGCSPGGTNNALVLFLGVNTYPDWAAQGNLWNVSGEPQGLDYLHNLAFGRKVCMAILLGDEWGDGHFASFNLESGYDFGQGIFYVSQGMHANYEPVASARLAQFDGTGGSACASDDDDGNRTVDRWEARIPWSALYASNGVADVTNLYLCGVIASDATNGMDRYLSGQVLGTPDHLKLDEYGNYGTTNFLTLDPIVIALPSGDTDGDGIPDDWERRYFSSLGAMSPFSDWDGDGVSDRDEYRAGTHPKDAASLLALHGIDRSAQPFERLIRWASVTGRVYTLMVSTNLQAGFQPLQTDLPSTPPENVYTDAAPAEALRFYRVRTEP